jgi:hypothetical protein
MNPRFRALVQLFVFAAVPGLLLIIFPRAFAFTELAAKELFYLWWLVLLVALAVWLIWGVSRKPK